MKLPLSISISMLLLIPGVSAMAADMTLYDFANPEAAAAWVPVHDVVMGGVSSGGVRVGGSGVMVFEGNLSLENNGGFASIRSLPQSRDLGAYEGVLLRVRGDGNRYKLNLRTDSNFDGVQYRVSFDTIAGEWQNLRFPFEEFVASFRGRSVPEAADLDPTRIVSFGLLISDKQEGAFRVEVDRIGAYLDQSKASTR